MNNHEHFPQIDILNTLTIKITPLYFELRCPATA